MLAVSSRGRGAMARSPRPVLLPCFAESRHEDPVRCVINKPRKQATTGLVTAGHGVTELSCCVGDRPMCGRVRCRSGTPYRRSHARR